MLRFNYHNQDYSLTTVQRLQRRHFATTPSQPPPATSTTSTRFAPYRQALNALAERTRTPLPSLIFSFAVLHEITAILPVVGFFYAARSLNVGNRLIDAFPEVTGRSSEHPGGVHSDEAVLPNEGWLLEKSREWWREGTKWAERVGKRYGVLGFEKRSGPDSSDAGGASSRDVWVTDKLPGDVVNAVVAYWLTKALLPVRVGVSLYLSPSFSRQIVEPIRIAVLRPFRRRHHNRD